MNENLTANNDDNCNVIKEINDINNNISFFNKKNFSIKSSVKLSLSMILLIGTRSSTLIAENVFQSLFLAKKVPRISISELIL